MEIKTGIRNTETGATATVTKWYSETDWEAGIPMGDHSRAAVRGSGWILTGTDMEGRCQVWRWKGDAEAASDSVYDMVCRLRGVEVAA